MSEKQEFIDYLKRKIIPNFKTMGMEATAGYFQKCLEYLEATESDRFCLRMYGRVDGDFYAYLESEGETEWSLDRCRELVVECQADPKYEEFGFTIEES